MNKQLIIGIGLTVLFICLIGVITIHTQSATAESKRVWVNDFKDGFDKSIDTTKQKPPKECKCSPVTKLGGDLNFIWNCRCGSKQCVVTGRYDGSNISCFKFVESLLK